MAATLADLITGRKTIKIKYKDAPEFSITFNPEFYTAEKDDEIQKRRDNEGLSALAATAEIIADAVSDWDVLGDDDKPLPPSVDVLKKLGANLLNHILIRMQEESLPNPGSGRS